MDSLKKPLLDFAVDSKYFYDTIDKMYAGRSMVSPA